LIGRQHPCFLCAGEMKACADRREKGGGISMWLSEAEVAANRADAANPDICNLRTKPAQCRQQLADQHALFDLPMCRTRADRQLAGFRYADLVKPRNAL